MPKTRRRDEGLLEEIMDAFLAFLRRAPWWAGPIAVLVTWLLFTFGIPSVVALLSGNSSDAGTRLMTGFAHGLSRYAWVPALIVAGIWVVALLAKLQDRERLGREQSLDELRSMDWREFEKLVAAAYRHSGYSVQETIGGADGGVDLVCNGRESGHASRLYVQCKRWKERQIGVARVRELAGVVASDGGQAAGIRGVFVTSGIYTDEARRFAEKAGLELVDGLGLLRLIREVQDRRTPQNVELRHSGQPVIAAIRTGASAEGERMSATAAAAEDVAPACPRCGREMVLRTARRGRQSGTAFWGCRSFPMCRGLRPLG